MIQRPLRVAFRLSRVGLHLAYGAAIVACVYPWISMPLQVRLRRNWSRMLLEMLGIRVRKTGHRVPRHGLLVANHVSWIDVFVIASVGNPVFVCKSDVRRWPVIGWLCARNDTIFIDRRSHRDASRVSSEIADRLAGGALVAVFPEGTSTDGAGVLPFRSALLQAAVEARSLVLPAALRYLDQDGSRTAVPEYSGDITFLDSLCAIAAQPEVIAELRLLPAIVAAGSTRRTIAEQAQARIQACLDRSNGRAAEPHGEPALPEIPSPARAAWPHPRQPSRFPCFPCP